MSVLPPSFAGTTGNILLVEEYGALAVAISSALKKFAPTHRTRVVSTLALAEAAVREAAPDLLIVDFDPPQPDAIQFFTKLRSQLPAARVLMIAAGLSKDVMAAHRSRFAFEFVEKPFELAELGRAVTALIAPGDRSAPTLRHVGLAEWLPLLCGAGETMMLRVDGAGGQAGEVHLAHGQVVHAVAAGQVGSPALQEMLEWSAPRLNKAERAAHTARTISAPWQTVLTDAFRQQKTAESPKPAEESIPFPAVEHTKTLLVIDDTELLLLFAEEILSTAIPELEIVTAGSGTEGVIQAFRRKPDAVLLDYSLPDITGDEVCRRLLEESTTTAIPVIMMSGHVPEMTATAERYDNVVATIAKPFLSHALVSLVREVIGGSRRRIPRTPPIAAEPSPPPPVQSALSAEPEPPTHEPDALGPDGPGYVVDDPRPSGEAPAAERIDRPPPPFEQNLSITQTQAVALEAPSTVQEPRVASIDRTPAVDHLAARPAPTSAAAYGAREALTTHLSGVAEKTSLAPTEPALPPVVPRPLAAVAIPSAKGNAVVLAIPLEVVAMQFSPTLRMAAIRARPSSPTASLHVQPQALPGLNLPEAGFELGSVLLNSRGHIETVRLTPTRHPVARLPRSEPLRVSDVAILPAKTGETMQLTPTTISPMTMQLFASFELAAVELSATFGVASLVLKSRGAEIRVTLQPGGPSTGATFKTAQVLLDREARIAEILLDAMA
ncbi:MAG: response regulator [Chthoniobacterales bacterium]